MHGGEIFVDQGFIGGCSGGLYQNILRAAEIIGNTPIGSDAFWLSVYPASQPMMMALNGKGVLNSLMAAGASIRSAFCGPCFGAGDVPSNGALSIRHATRNFPNREGSKPGDGQISYVALMDARSIAATAQNHGRLTSAFELETRPRTRYTRIISLTTRRTEAVYRGVGMPKPEAALIFGPNIADWPKMFDMTENLLIRVASAIYDRLRQRTSLSLGRDLVIPFKPL